MAFEIASMEQAVLWLGEPGSADPERVGGKAAQLSRLAARYPVPPGFCLPATSLRSVFASSSTATLDAIVQDAYRDLAHRTGQPAPPVAVRSSALDEDGQITSFAGQHETVLNLRGVDEIASAIRLCWESGRSSRARAYRLQHGLAVDQAEVAVLVQQLVLADVSVVAFSANPITGDRGQTVVTASYGLGESLVSGTVTPDTWIVDKATGTIVSCTVGAKERMTIPASGGTQEVVVPRLLRGQLALNDEQIGELLALLVTLERFQGWAVDLECAYAQNRLQLLQCRPITSRLLSTPMPKPA